MPLARHSRKKGAQQVSATEPTPHTHDVPANYVKSDLAHFEMLPAPRSTEEFVLLPVPCFFQDAFKTKMRCALQPPVI